MNITKKIAKKAPCNYMFFKKVDTLKVLDIETNSLFYQTQYYNCQRLYKRISSLC